MPIIILVLASNFNLIFNCNFLLVNVGEGSWLVGLSNDNCPHCFVVHRSHFSLIYSHSTTAMHLVLASFTKPVVVVQILLLLLGKSTWVTSACCSFLWSIIWIGSFTPRSLRSSNTANECDCAGGTCPVVSRIPHPPVSCHCPCSPLSLLSPFLIFHLIRFLWYDSLPFTFRSSLSLCIPIILKQTPSPLTSPII